MSDSSVRPMVIAGNWKMYKTIEEAKNFVETLAPRIKKSQGPIYLAVPYTAIFPTSQRVKELKAPFRIGAQNMNDAHEGAFTGEIAATMLKDAGAQFVILGHSERRRYFHEGNSLIHRKLKRALEEKIEPILCIGENSEERKNGEWQSVLRRQIEGCLEGIAAPDIAKIIFAYEPVWAIGTGQVATPEEAQDAHMFCRQVIGEKGGSAIAENFLLLYGGSVKTENAADLIIQPDIDGFLVGGSSLSAETFYQIITTAIKARTRSLKKIGSST